MSSRTSSCSPAWFSVKKLLLALVISSLGFMVASLANILPYSRPCEVGRCEDKRNLGRPFQPPTRLCFGVSLLVRPPEIMKEDIHLPFYQCPRLGQDSQWQFVSKCALTRCTRTDSDGWGVPSPPPPSVSRLKLKSLLRFWYDAIDSPIGTCPRLARASRGNNGKEDQPTQQDASGMRSPLVMRC